MCVKAFEQVEIIGFITAVQNVDVFNHWPVVFKLTGKNKKFMMRVY